MAPLQTVYLTSSIFLAFFGITVFLRIRQILKTGRIQVKKGRYAQVQQLIEKLNNEELTRTMTESGVPLTSVQYQLLRYTLLSVWLFSSLISATMKGGDVVGSVLTVGLVFCLTSPTAHILNRRTPFKIVMDLLTERHKYKKNLELYRAISQLKNLILIKEQHPPGSTYILEQLNRFTHITKPIFNRLLSLWYVGRFEEAKDYFVKAMNTENAEEIANLFLKLDGMNPIELKNQLILFQEDFKQKRQTEKLKMNQYRSYAVYAIVAISLMLVLVNFMVVAVLLDMMDTFKQFY